jgi:hypothetical protein
MEYILGHLERLKEETPKSEPRLWECVKQRLEEEEKVLRFN